jgi:hypothetical protein
VRSCPLRNVQKPLWTGTILKQVAHL